MRYVRFAHREIILKKFEYELQRNTRDHPPSYFVSITTRPSQSSIGGVTWNSWDAAR